jgi:hypothetical protein
MEHDTDISFARKPSAGGTTREHSQTVKDPSAMLQAPHGRAFQYI